MKFPLIYCIVLFLCSCNEESGKPTANTAPLKKDTNITRPNKINPYGPLDISQMDISYFPTDFPVLKMTKGTDMMPVARVIYSRPHKQGRKIFGSLLKYGEPWRLGANEASEIEFFQPVSIQQKTVNKGRYIIYCIPQETKWTIVFNTNIYTWGLKQDQTKDVYRFDIPVKKTATDIENFTMVFQDTPSGADLVIAWDDVEARLPFTII